MASRPTLNDHLSTSVDTEFYAAVDARDRAYAPCTAAFGASAIFGAVALIAALAFMLLSLLAATTSGNDPSGMSAGQLLVVSAISWLLVAALGWVAWHADRTMTRLESRLRDLNAKRLDLVRASVKADVRTTYGITLVSDEVPLESRVAVDAVSKVAGGRVVVREWFPAADKPVMVAQEAPLATLEEQAASAVKRRRWFSRQPA